MGFNQMRLFLLLILSLVFSSLYSQNTYSEYQSKLEYNYKLQDSYRKYNYIGAVYVGAGVCMVSVGSYSLFRYELKNSLILCSLGCFTSLAGLVIIDSSNSDRKTSYTISPNGIIINF